LEINLLHRYVFHGFSSERIKSEQEQQSPRLARGMRSELEKFNKKQLRYGNLSTNKLL